MWEQPTILFMTERFKQRLEKSTEYLITELYKQCNLLLSKESGDIREIVARQSHRPDFILVNDYKPEYSPRLYGLALLDIPTGALVHEIKYKKYQRNRFYTDEQIDILFVFYQQGCLKAFPQLADRFEWFPHHVPLDIFKNYGEGKPIDYLMMGCMLPNIYPERVAMYELLRREPGFVYHEHPGYLALNEEKKYLIGYRYARELSRAKMFITCDSVEKFPVMKYFEALACQTLLLATGSAELTELGFIDGKTFVEVNRSNILDKAHYYLSNESKRNEIINKGYEMVKKHHSTEQRVSELVSIVIQLKNKK